MNARRGNAEQAVTAFLEAASEGSWRAVAPGEWGLVVDDVAGAPLDVGLRLDGGLLRAQAWVAPAGAADPHRLLHRNRLRPLVRYAHSAGGDVHVHADVPAGAVADDGVLDRMLGELVEAAGVVREAAASA
jgi:hypothetical protein